MSELITNQHVREKKICEIKCLWRDILRNDDITEMVVIMTYVDCEEKEENKVVWPSNKNWACKVMPVCTTVEWVTGHKED